MHEHHHEEENKKEAMLQTEEVSQWDNQDISGAEKKRRTMGSILKLVKPEAT